MSNIERLKNSLFLQNDVPGPDAALITSEPNCRYLSGFQSSARTILVTREEAYFLTDFRYAEAAGKKIKDCKVIMYEKQSETLRDLLRRHNVKDLLFEYGSLSYAEADKYRLICSDLDITPCFDQRLDQIMERIRAIKQPYELEKMRAAQKITDDSFFHILSRIQEGVTEREIALEIEFFMKRQGAERLAFDLIVVSGENGSQCHGVPGSKKIAKGDFITMDIGAVVDGYHSDMTRTVALGSVTDEQREVYDTVYRAQTTAANAVKPGVECSRIDWIARSIIEEKYKGKFGHSTGHGVGIEIHEWPRYSPVCSALTEPGMVITVEPGIYLEGKFGVRIEDMVLVTESGCENLTHSPKELIIL